jgi:hypothetical protein
VKARELHLNGSVPIGELAMNENKNEAGLAYAGHLQAEHRELHRRVRALQSEFKAFENAILAAPLRDRLVKLGEDLYDDLAHHFSEEDAGGCMEYAASRAPGLAGEVRALEQEHPALLGQLRNIVTQLQAATPGAARTAEFIAAFDAFFVRLLSHEARENRVVERGLNLVIDD